MLKIYVTACPGCESLLCCPDVGHADCTKIQANSGNANHKICLKRAAEVVTEHNSFDLKRRLHPSGHYPYTDLPLD